MARFPVTFPEMKTPKRSAVTTHRKHQRAKGFVRVEVQAPAADAALIREVAAELRSGIRRAAEVRSFLRRSLRPRQSLKELLTMDLDVPDEVFDAAVARPRDVGREFDL